MPYYSFSLLLLKVLLTNLATFKLKSLYLKDDLNTELTVYEYLREIYNKEVQKLIRNFIETSEQKLLTKKLGNISKGEINVDYKMKFPINSKKR
jgi:hypothetical protein